MWKWLPVYLYNRGLKAYSIIEAKYPSAWGGPWKKVDDNAGDADAAGDGSACMEAEFLEYDSNLNSDEGKAKDIQEAKPEVKPSSKQGTSSLLLGMPIKEIVSPSVVFVVVT